MPALSMNADPRPLPVGWTAHFDHQRNVWYYVNLNVMPPQLSLVHPDDQGRSSNVMPVRQRRDTVPGGSMANLQHNTRRLMPNSHSTPFAVAIEAQNAKELSFAQKLYASSLPASLLPRNEEGVIPEEINGLYGFSYSDVPWRTPSPQEALDTIPTQTVYSSPPLSPLSVPSMSFSASSNSASPTFSPPPFSSPIPEWNPRTVTPAPSRRPRGARTPSFPRPSIRTFLLPSEEDNPRDGDSLVFSDRSSPQIHHVFQPASHIGCDIPQISSVSPPPPLSTPPPVCAPAAMAPAPRPYFPSNLPNKRTRHNRSATFPNITSMNPMGGHSQSSVMSKPKETPMYTLVARPPEGPVGTTNISSSSTYNNLLPISPIPIYASQTKPILPPLIIPNPTGTGLPMDAAIPVPNLTIPPTQPSLNNDQRLTLVQGGIANLHQEGAPNPPNATHGNHEVLKQVGIAVGKSVGKSALRIGTKVLLGSMGIPTNPFSSNNSDSGDVISSGIANMVASAASAAATAAMKPSHQPSTNVPSSTNSAPDYAAILAQVQGMQSQQPVQQIMPQQIVPQQTGFDASNAQMAALIAQMQMLQLQQQQCRPPAQIPPGNNVMAAQNTVQNIPQQQRPQWQQSLVSNAIGGATHALVSGAMSNLNIPSTMDSDNGASSFTDFDSFDANA